MKSRFFTKDPESRALASGRARLIAAGLALSLLFSVTGAGAEDFYGEISLGDLLETQSHLDEEKREEIRNEILENQTPTMGFWGAMGRNRPVLRLEQSVQGFMTTPNAAQPGVMELRNHRLVVRFPNQATEVRGFLDVASEERGGWLSWEFKLDPGEMEEVGEERWREARRSHYQVLADSELPGTAVFRLLATDGDATGDDENDRPRRIRRPEGDMNSTFEIFSGGRAVAENLALDQDMFVARDDGERKHELDEIPGVTVAEFDWEPLLEDEPPVMDELAAVIPHDQHVMFLDSTADLLQLLSTFQRELGPWLNGAQQSTGGTVGYGSIGRRYLRQMGLSTEAISELSPFIDGLAITGFDPFLSLGTDVAIVMETDRPGDLLKELTAHVEKAAQGRNDVAEPLPAPWLGDDPSGWRAWASPGRELSVYLVKVGRHVVLSNSEQSLRRLHDVKLGQVPSLASLDEYRFFRQRYRLGEPETAFGYISDATLRRWTGPVTRIGASRRTRALAALRDINWRRGLNLKGRDFYSSFLGELKLMPAGQGEIHGGVRSEKWGTAAFLKPLIELDLAAATEAEREAYERWRRGYETSWSAFFDPIALRVHVGETRRDFDLTVIPLTNSSEYQTMVSIAGDAFLDSLSTRRAEETLMQLSFAVDPDGRMFQQVSSELSAALPGLRTNPLGWMGGSVSLFVDRDMIWSLLAEGGELGSMFESELESLPIGARVSVRNPMGLSLFLTAIKGFMELSAPGLVSWQPGEHDGQDYVTVSSRQREGMNDFLGQLSIHYAPMEGALLLTLSESVLKRAIERENEHAGHADQEGGDPREPRGRRGGSRGNQEGGQDDMAHAFVEMDTALLEVIKRQASEGGDEPVLRSASWRALPLLNALRQEVPEARAGLLLKSWSGMTPSCPGGEGYRWDAEDFTYESVVFGHPGDPRNERANRPEYVAFGGQVRFEHGGLRARSFIELAGPETPELMERLGRLSGVLSEGHGKPLAKVADLWPTETGSKLIYRERNSWSDGEVDVSEMTVEVLEVIERDDDRLVREKSVSGEGEGEDGWTDISEYTIAADGIRYTGSSGDDYEIDYQVGELMVPSRLLEGFEYAAPFSYTDKLEDEQNAGHGTVVLRVKGMETVEVEAGTFQDCVRIDWNTVEHAPLFGGLTRTTGTTWYKPGVGMVKTESRETDGYRYESELIEAGQESD